MLDKEAENRGTDNPKTSCVFASSVLFVDDLEGTMQYYEEALGLERKFFDPGYGFGKLGAEAFELGIATISCGQRLMPGMFPFSQPSSVYGVELAFYSEKVDQSYERAIRAGGRELLAPTDQPWGQRVAYLQAPEGTIICLCTPLPE